jgi:hypothetical protein
MHSKALFPLLNCKMKKTTLLFWAQQFINFGVFLQVKAKKRVLSKNVVNFQNIHVFVSLRSVYVIKKSFQSRGSPKKHLGASQKFLYAQILQILELKIVFFDFKGWKIEPPRKVMHSIADKSMKKLEFQQLTLSSKLTKNSDFSFDMINF